MAEEAQPGDDNESMNSEVDHGQEVESNLLPNDGQDTLAHDTAQAKQSQAGRGLVQALINTFENPSDQVVDQVSDTDSLPIDPETGAVIINYDDGIPSHAAHLREFFTYNGPGMGDTFTVYPDDDNDEPFGTFMKVVTELSHPIETFYPFLKTWWQFISLYTPRLLT